MGGVAVLIGSRVYRRPAFSDEKASMALEVYLKLRQLEKMASH